MLILALNCGSSSLKAALVDSSAGAHLLVVRVENIGADARLHAGSESRYVSASTQEEALRLVLDEVRRRSSGPIAAVAHRVVHGGEALTRPVVIDDEVAASLEKLVPLAPLHNPPALQVVRAARIAVRDVPHVAVFDTAFHATLPPRAREYALPDDVRTGHGVRRYGFHGLSHEHVMRVGSAHLRSEPARLRILSCHLGAGASVAAIEYGRSVETSMGMTPLEGLVMATRAGDVDPGVLLRLMREGYDPERLDDLLNRRSGLVGLAGSGDMRRIEQLAAEGNESCRLAITLYAHRLRKYIGAYAAVMGGVDVIAFTGGVGENSALIRHRCLQRLEFLGAALDEDANRDARVSLEQPVAEISAPHSRTRLLVVRADEEHALARAAASLIEGRARGPREALIPVAVSARHAHLSQATIERLFGSGYRLEQRAPLSQTGQYAAQETVSLIGPRGRIDGVRILGPPRSADQVEISRSDEFTLGVDAPVRISGDLANTPGITLEGPRGRVPIRSGVICARRHVHMSPADAERLGVHDHQRVRVRIDSEGRDLTFEDVTVRVAPDFRLELHLDTDEANAARLSSGATGWLMLD
jgi:acetate kinase